MTLPARTIGPFTLSAVGLGCMNLSHAYGTRPTEAEAVALLNHALDAGVTHLDTAAIYGAGANERLIAKAVGHRRRDFTLASKCVLDLIDGQRVLDGRPETIARSLDAALGRLDTDHIDLYYLHRLDRDVPVEDSVGALARAVEAGKIGAIGLSEMSAATIRRAHAAHPIAAVQTEYSLWTRNAEVAVLDLCAELGIGFVAFSPLGRGLLAGGVEGDDFVESDLRRAMPRFQQPNLDRNLALYRQLADLARAAGTTPAALAIAWVLDRRPFVLALPGTRSIAHLDEDLAGATLTASRDLLDAADAIFAADAVAGARYPAAAQAQIDTELIPGEVLAA